MSCHDIAAVMCSINCPRSASRGNRDCSGGIWCQDCVRTYSKLNEPFANRKDLECPLCHSLVAKRTELRASTCYSVLDSVFPSVDQYVEQLKKNPEKMEDEDLTDPAVCRKCGEDCKTQRGLWSHRRISCPYTVLPCKKCNNVYLLRKDLQKHHDDVHGYVQCLCCNERIGKQYYKTHILQMRAEHVKKTLQLQKELSMSTTKLQWFDLEISSQSLPPTVSEHTIP